MRGSVSVARNSASEVTASFSREILKPSSVQNVGKKLPGYSFGRLCRALWPQKTPAAIEFYTDMPERTARHVAADKSDPSSINLAQIIDSDQGWRALEWIMRDSKQPWWIATKRAVRVARAFDNESQQFEMEV
jgi:hypothetical protein